MKLITAKIQKQLEKNRETENDQDLPLKLFNATGGQTWLINSIEEDGDTMWGLADLGFGCVEFGTMSLSEMLETKRRLGFRFMLERDRSWKGGQVSDYIGLTNLAGC